MSFLSKSQLIRLIAADTGLSQKKSFNIVNVLLGIIKHHYQKERLFRLGGSANFMSKTSKSEKEEILQQANS